MSAELFDLVSFASDNDPYISLPDGTTFSAEDVAEFNFANAQMALTAMQEIATELDKTLAALPESTEVAALKDEMLGLQAELSINQEDLLHATLEERESVVPAVQKNIVELNERLLLLKTRIEGLSK